MTWYDDKLPASLGGIALHYQEVSTTAGRRTSVHEFYGDSREAYVEDIGPVTWRATINVFLVGLDYNVQRDALVEVLNSKGPHEFVHPLRGPIMVRLGSEARLDESVREGGMVRIGQLDLVQAGLAYPVVTMETGPRLVKMAFDAAAIMAANTTLDASDAIDPVRTGVLDALRSVIAAIRKANGRATATLNQVDSLSNQINQLEEGIDAMLNSPAALMSSLTGLGLAVYNLFGQFEFASRSVTVEDPVFPVVAEATAAIDDLASFTTVPVAAAWLPSGPQQELAAAAHAEIQLQTQALAFIGGAGIAGKLPYASASEAGALLTKISNGLAAAMSAPTLASEAHQALAELRATVIRNVIDRQAKLPQVVQITTPAAMPAVVLSWELYGDASRASELVRANRVRNALMVPGGTELEVTVDV